MKKVSRERDKWENPGKGKISNSGPKHDSSSNLEEFTHLNLARNLQEIF